MTRPADDAMARALDAAIPESVRTIARVFGEAGYRSWIVGGSVRDVLLQLEGSESGLARSASDWDLATDAHPDDVMRLFRRVIPTGIAHGTVTIVLGGAHYEVTTLRGETTYTDGRRPDEVRFVDDLHEDLARRDFTVNAIAYDVRARTLHDPFGGVDDLRRRTLRAVGAPELRFSEDGLRVVRCARLASVLGLEVEPSTRAGIRPSLASYRKVAIERIQAEWLKALAGPRPSIFLEIVGNEGMLEITFPELFATDHEGAPGESAAFGRALELLDRSNPDPIRRLALILVLGSRAPDVPRELATRFRLSNEQKDRIARLALHPRLPDFAESGGPLPAPLVRRFVREIGAEFIADYLTFAGELGKDVQALSAAIERERDEGHALSPKDLAISGKDLLDAKVVEKGPEVGRILRELFELVLDDPTANEKSALLRRAKELGARG